MFERTTHPNTDTGMDTRLIYGASLVSIVLSLLFARKNMTLASFIGLWAPTILGLGILSKENKLLERTA